MVERVEKNGREETPLYTREFNPDTRVAYIHLTPIDNPIKGSQCITVVYAVDVEKYPNGVFIYLGGVCEFGHEPLLTLAMYIEDYSQDGGELLSENAEGMWGALYNATTLNHIRDSYGFVKGVPDSDRDDFEDHLYNQLTEN